MSRYVVALLHEGLHLDVPVPLQVEPPVQQPQLSSGEISMKKTKKDIWGSYRGGSVINRKDHCRSVGQLYCSLSERAVFIGFRLVREVK